MLTKPAAPTLFTSTAFEHYMFKYYLLKATKLFFIIRLVFFLIYRIYYGELKLRI